MDVPEEMYQQSHGTSSSPTNKRKRGRPRRDDIQTQLQVNPPVSTIGENLIGQVVSGVVEGSFEAGYFLNVKIADTENQLKGVVFLPEKVTPVTPTTDLFPQAKMFSRQDIPTLPQGKKNAANQTDDIGSVPQTDNLISHKNQSASEDIDERNRPMDTHTQMKDVGGSCAVEKLSEPEGQSFSLVPQYSSDDAPKEDHTVLRSDSCAGSKTAVTVTTSSPKDSIAEDSTTTLVDFFPAAETNQNQTTGSSSTLSLDLFKNKSKQSGTKEDKSFADAEARGVEEKPAFHIDDVPKELQLELGNKKMSASSAIAAEAKPDQFASSKSEFLVNLFEGREETAKEGEEPNEASKSGSTEATIHK